jgi:hypothetical protein
MAALRLGVPALLLLWFLWRARRNHLFLLGIPVLMVMGPSIFFDRIAIFWKPGRFEPQTHIMMWLVVVWVAIMWLDRRTDQGPEGGIFGVSRPLPEELPFVAVAVLLALHVLGLFSSGGDLATAVTTASGFCYILLGYLLVRGIAARFSRAQIIEFLGAVVVANTVAATLYVAHQGLHIDIYPASEYFSTVFQGQTITRTFTFAPQFSVLALAFVLARRSWTPGWLVVLAVTLLAVVVSYTRTLLIAALVAVVLAVVVREMKNPHAGRLVRRVLTLSASVAGAFVLFRLVRPAEFRFLMSRLSEFASSSGPTDVGNWDIRRTHFAAVLHVVARGDLFLGLGFPAAGSNAVDAHLHIWTSDMAWVPLLYRLGWVGVGLFGLAFAGFILRSLLLSQQQPEERRYLGLVYLITIVLTVILSFVGWTFMEERVYAMGLWPLAFAAAEALRPREAADLAEVAGQTEAASPPRELAPAGLSPPGAA